MCACLRLLLIFFSVFFCCGKEAFADFEHVTPRTLDSLERQLRKPMHDTLRIQTLNSLADHLKSIDVYRAMKYLEESLAICGRVNYPKGKGICLGLMATLYERMFDYRKALFYYLRSLRIFEEMGDIRLQAVNFNYIGSIYMWIEKYDLARKYYLESLKVNAQLGLRKTYGVSYNNLGVVAYKTGKVEEAVRYYKKTIELSNEFGSLGVRVPALLNLGMIYSDKGMYDTAESYYRQALAVIDNNRDSITAYSGLGNISVERKQFSKAEKYFSKGITLAQKTGIVYLLKDLYQSLSNMYEKMGDYRQALKYRNLHYIYKDSALNNSTSKKISDLQAAYEVEKKDKEIQLLDQQKQVAEVQGDNQRLIRNLAIVVAIAVLLIGLIVARNIVLRQKMRNRMLNEENIRMEKDNAQLQHENSEARYEVLKSKTNPHFLFNGFTMLSSLIIKDPRSAITYIEHFSELYRMILRSDQGRLVNLEEEMELVLHYIYVQQRWYREDLKVEVDVPESRMYKVPSFAVQMLVENAIKHNIVSAEHPLYISVTLQGSEIVVKNNLQLKSVHEPSTGMGQKNITERYRLIGTGMPHFVQQGNEYIASLPLLTISEEVAV